MQIPRTTNKQTSLLNRQKDSIERKKEREVKMAQYAWLSMSCRTTMAKSSHLFTKLK